MAIVEIPRWGFLSPLWGHPPNLLVFLKKISQSKRTFPSRETGEQFHLPIYVFPEMKLRGLVPNFHIHVSINDLCMIGPPILLQQIRQTDHGNI